jgi:hypothetical protein
VKEARKAETARVGANIATFKTSVPTSQATLIGVHSNKATTI